MQISQNFVAFSEYMNFKNMYNFFNNSYCFRWLCVSWIWSCFVNYGLWISHCKITKRLLRMMSISVRLQGKVQKKLKNGLDSMIDPITFAFSENSNYWRESLLEVITQNIAGWCQQNFCIQKKRPAIICLYTSSKLSRP